jgi:hypothetical protein
MKLKDLEEVVEQNIVRLFTVFYENPAIFITESDVKSYLYSLLINDPFIKNFTPQFRNEHLRKESKTFIVHTELSEDIRGKEKGYDLLIFNPTKFIDLECCGTTIAVEIKFNRREPARKEKSSIVEDIKKAKHNRLGYVLWLNWDRPIDDTNLKTVKMLVDRCRNVELFYLDVFSEPPKTNLEELLKHAN